MIYVVALLIYVLDYFFRLAVLGYNEPVRVCNTCFALMDDLLAESVEISWGASDDNKAMKKVRLKRKERWNCICKT